MINLLPLPSALQRLTTVVAPAILPGTFLLGTLLLSTFLLSTLALVGSAYADTATPDLATKSTTKSAANTDKNLSEKLAKQHLVQGEVVDSISNYVLDGWNYVDNNHIVIHTGPSKHYLVTLMISCHDLSSVENIAFTTTVDRLTKFDRLMVRGPGNIVQHCPIKQINALTKTKDKS
jgi:hypothetical protein